MLLLPELAATLAPPGMPVGTAEAPPCTRRMLAAPTVMTYITAHMPMQLHRKLLIQESAPPAFSCGCRMGAGHVAEGQGRCQSVRKDMPSMLMKTCAHKHKHTAAGRHAEGSANNIQRTMGCTMTCTRRALGPKIARLPRAAA